MIEIEKLNKTYLKHTKHAQKVLFDISLETVSPIVGIPRAYINLSSVVFLEDSMFSIIALALLSPKPSIFFM